MILIFSNNFDQSTNKVIKWLEALKTPYFRINEDNPLKDVEVEINGEELSDFTLIFKHGRSIKYTEIKSIWYRRDGLSLDETLIKNLSEPLQVFYRNEFEILKEFIYIQFQRKPILGSFFNVAPNKLETLRKAAEVGLKIPSTAISSSIDCIKKFMKKEGCCITKPLYEIFDNSSLEERSYTLTEKVTQKILNHEDQLFFSLVQENIKKKYEIRCFYLAGMFYSMAIFSQENSATEVDFRNYDSNRPNRLVPYVLPLKLEKKLDKLMKLIGHNTGSIDLLVDNKDIHYFLEVNPVGQYDMLSEPNNFQLNKKVAEYLSSYK